MAIYGYTRVSTGRAARDGESLSVQEQVIAGQAMMLGQPVARMFVETGVSGSVPITDRPVGGELLKIVKRGDIIITPKLDRMFRSALDALTILKDIKTRGVSLYMIDLGGDVTGNGISKLVFTILSAVAEAERDRIRERISDVKADQKARGRYLGGKVPFGYRVIGKGKQAMLEAIPEQQAVIALARDLRACGVTLERIRAELPIKLGLNTLAEMVREPRS